MQINISDIWSDTVKKKHQLYVEGIINNALPPRSSLIAELLIAYSTCLATGQPETLRQVIKVTESRLKIAPTAERVAFQEECTRIFDYGRFAAKSTKNWNAYSLCSNSNYRLCPYCQQSLAVTIYRDSKSGALRPTLDHFYPKHKYPYLALSLYNLIPSCHPCNSSLKGQKDFYKKEHLHPYEDDETIRYDFDVASYIQHRELALTTPTPQVSIRALPSTHRLHDKLQRSIETFLAQERLAISEPEINRFIETLISYSPERLEEINQTIFSSSNFALTPEVAIGFSRANYKNEWLGAIKRDLYDVGWEF
ncbi:hypothetical protein M5G25_18315 [Pseudomonas sp. TNT2022 ID357]|uniref:HNH endonuclease n=1 Tax=Pseudomonas idahonensis TaxID=2942628 RepID=A0ABT5Q7R8_9PSED|nr:hypothetical protein [Pseudomonas idahonensis]MDD1150244.1 hypothetical protein [Pseudomonas idahonensis]